MKILIEKDKEKAKSLLHIAKISLTRLNEFDKLKYPTNTLTDYYDIIHKLMESLSLLEGIKIKGEGAHQELIDYICKKYNFKKSEWIFLHELRDYRNRISYEGFNINVDYIKIISQKLKK